MSNEIFKAAEYQRGCLKGTLFVLALLIVILGISGIVGMIHNRKNKRLRKSKYLADMKYLDDLDKIDGNEDLQLSKKFEAREQARAEKSATYEEIEEKTKKLEKRFSKIDEVLNFFKISVGFITLFLYLMVLIQSFFMGGAFSKLIKVENTKQDDISVEAYYIISYFGVEQDTLAIFVKNNSEKTLKNAEIYEKTTGISSKVTTLDPGQEKIVTLEVYPDGNYNYSFGINNVEYNN